MIRMPARPAHDEYSSYFAQYVELVPEGDIRELLARQLDDTSARLSAVSETQADYRYAPDKWSLKELLGHMTDTERVMSYRSLRVARGDKTSLPGFDQDEFVRGASFQSAPWSDRLEEYAAVRRSTLLLLRGLSEEAWLRRGLVKDSEMSARALAYIIAGHERHHLNVIVEKYLT
ncbi:DinB family protein [Paenibacillus sp. P26]|nr:DinB family protein [Paenibacillus sp. P26]UUZ90271.1 DinB family protein [Paenibacillus sp. P25]